MAFKAVTRIAFRTQQTYVTHNCNKTCKEMSGATSVMPVIGDVFSVHFTQQAADTTQWADTTE